MKDREKKIVFLSIIFLQFTFLGWQREFSVGQDTLAYYNYFKTFSKFTFSEVLSIKLEPGYVFWNWLIYNLGFDYHAFLLFTGAFIYYSFCRFFYKYSKSVWLSVVIFIAFNSFFQSLFILRQYIALSIVLYAYDFMLQHRWKAFVFLIFFASLFHISALFFIPTYFIYQKKFDPIKLAVIFGCSFFIARIFGDLVMSNLFVSFQYAEKYIEDANSGHGYSMLILLIGIMTAALLFRPKILNDKDRLFYWLFYISLCLQPFATQVGMVSRGILYWFVSINIIIPLFLNNIRKKNFRLASYICVITLLILFFKYFTNFNEGIESYATYEFYHNKYL